MPIRIKPEFETFNDVQVLSVNMLALYFICSGYMETFPVKRGQYEQAGVVYLHQFSPETDEEEAKRKSLYDEAAAVENADLPPYEDLAEFDGLIPIKISYSLEVDEKGQTQMRFGEPEQLAIDDQLTYDDDGNIVRATIFDKENEVIG